MKLNRYLIVSLLALFSAVLCTWNFDPQIIQTRNDDTSLLYYGGSSPNSDYFIEGVQPEPYNTGLVLYPTKLPVREGFYLEFDWLQRPLSARNSSLTAFGGNGFAAIFLKDLPTNEQVKSSVGTLGVGRVPNAYVMGYSATYNEFYVCHWTEALPIVQTPAFLRSYCNVIPYQHTLTCNVTACSFYVRSYYDYIEVSLTTMQNVLFRAPWSMDSEEDYYVGFSFGNDNYYNYQQHEGFVYYYRELRTNFDSSQDLNTQIFQVETCGLVSRFNPFRLTSGTDQFGSSNLIYVVRTHNGFVTKYTWTPTTCDEFGIGGDGFSFFLSKYDPECATDTIANFPNITAVTYSAAKDLFWVCQWEKPIGQFDDSSACVSAANPLPRLGCGNSYNFVVYFANNALSVFVDNTLILTTPFSMEDRPYFPGFAGTTASPFYFEQYITNWVIETDLSVANLSDYLPASFITPPVADTPSLVTLGTAQKIGQTVRLTTGGSESGLVYFSQPIGGKDLQPFASSFTWTPTNCDAEYNGADGWAFFLTKNVPTLEQVQSSSGGLLGIQNVPNVVMAAYSATYNEFWISNWTLPFPDNFHWVSANAPVSGPKYTCGGIYTFTVVYSEPNLEIRLNNQVMISAQVDIDQSTPYYFGLSGGTGGGYFQQDVTNWIVGRPVF